MKTVKKKGDGYLRGIPKGKNKKRELGLVDLTPSFS